VLVDTTIWSLALRRRSHDLHPQEQQLVAHWRMLVEARRAVLIGPIRQEILSGIRQEAHFEGIQLQLDAFPYLGVLPMDYDCAAGFYNQCCTKGIAASHVDLLICAVASRCRTPIFTTDKDFSRYAQNLPVQLYAPRLEIS
jgi:predicted nucleic acid-binding protein